MLCKLFRLTAVLVTFVLVWVQAQGAVATSYQAELTRDSVLPTPSGPTPANVQGHATFEFVQPDPNTVELIYEITLQNVDTAAWRSGASSADTPSITTDDLAAIHVHFVASGSSQNKETPHVLNILGAPLNTMIGLMEDDLGLVSFDPNTLTTVFSGRWDEADVLQTAGLAEGPRTKPLADHLDELVGEELFMMIHTSGNSDGAIGGTLLAVPEPVAIQLALVSVLLSSCCRSCGRGSWGRRRR